MANKGLKLNVERKVFVVLHPVKKNMIKLDRPYETLYNQSIPVKIILKLGKRLVTVVQLPESTRGKYSYSLLVLCCPFALVTVAILSKTGQYFSGTFVAQA